MLRIIEMLAYLCTQHCPIYLTIILSRQRLVSVEIGYDGRNLLEGLYLYVYICVLRCFQGSGAAFLVRLQYKFSTSTNKIALVF